MLNRYSKSLFFLITLSSIFVKNTYCMMQQPSQDVQLHMSISNGDIYAVARLLAANADPNARIKKVGWTHTPLHSAVQLIEKDPTSALHIIRLLLDYNADSTIRSRDTELGGEGKSALEIVSSLRGEGYEKALELFNEKLQNPEIENGSCCLQ